MITVRRATAEDAEWLLAMANEPSTRAAGFHPSPIDPVTHRRWLAERLDSPSCRLFIGFEHDRPVGQVRLDADAAGRVEVGISVAADVRGQGFGRALLHVGLAAGVADPGLGARVFVARIRPGNRASVALFAGAGFEPAGTDEVAGVRCLVYQRRSAHHPPWTVAIVQARIGSMRLPGKVLLPLLGEPILTRVMRRTARARRLDAVVVATTVSPADDAIVGLAEREGWPAARGSVDDVLDRYMVAARTHGADVIVRITSDCPLIDPDVIDAVIEAFAAGGCDFASNTLKRTYPRGLDVEVIAREALDRAWHEDADPAWREHVTPYLYRHPESFRLRDVTSTDDHSDQRWVVDTAEDYELVRRIYEALGRDDFSWREALAVVDRHPEWRDLNREVVQKVVPSAGEPR